MKSITCINVVCRVLRGRPRLTLDAVLQNGLSAKGLRPPSYERIRLHEFFPHVLEIKLNRSLQTSPRRYFSTPS